MSEHKEDCKCEVCEKGLKAYAAQEELMMERYGWIIHAVVEGTDDPDLHTHGLPQLLDHPDLQIKIRGPQEVGFAGQAMHNAVDFIKQGGKFTPGTVYTGILFEGSRLTVRENEECDRTVLLFCLPH